MTERGCRGPRALLMDFALDELDPLKRQRVETHVERCAECRALLDRYSGAFESAKSWEPEIAEDDLDRMVSRLTPYIEAQRPRRGPTYLAAGFAMAAAASVLFAVTRPRAPEPTAAPAVAEVAPPPAAPVEKVQPTRHLRVVSSADWNGEVAQPTPDVTRVKMSTGFAVMSFEGGKGRKLQIVAPDVTVEVIGTRFYVEKRPDEPTVVGVVSGRVRVRSNGTESEVSAGEAHSFDREGMKRAENIESAAHHADRFLEYEPEPEPEPEPVEVEVEPIVERPVKKQTVAKPRPKVRRVDPMNAVVEAERLARDGRHAEAALMYSRAIEETPSGTLADVMRFERARLWAFKLRRQGEAKAALTALASGRGEVATQARLTLCELDRVPQPCRSKRCLEQLAADGVKEADQTITRWGLDRFDCAP